MIILDIQVITIITIITIMVLVLLFFVSLAAHDLGGHVESRPDRRVLGLGLVQVELRLRAAPEIRELDPPTTHEHVRSLAHPKDNNEDKRQEDITITEEEEEEEVWKGL